MIGFAFREMAASMSIGRTRVLMTMTTVSIALLIFSGFLLISHNLNIGIDRFRSTSKLDVIIKENANGAAIAAEISKLPEVKSARVYSKEDAMAYFRDNLGADLARGITEAYGDLPFFSFIEVSLKERMAVPDEFVARLKKIEGVTEVLYGKDTVRRLAKIADVIRYSTVGIGAIMSLFILLIMLNGIRSTVHARKEDIYIMRLVGASDGFIRMPFLMEGAATSFVGSLIGMGIVYAAYYQVKAAVTFVEIEFMPLEIVVATIVFAAALGALGGVIAVRESIKGVH